MVINFISEKAQDMIDKGVATEIVDPSELEFVTDKRVAFYFESRRITKYVKDEDDWRVVFSITI